MKREEALAACSYYHGEELNPFQPGTPSADFWLMERDFCNVFYASDVWGSDEMLSWLTEKDEKAAEFVNRFDNPNKRVMLASICMIRYDHAPDGGFNFILKYEE